MSHSYLPRVDAYSIVREGCIDGNSVARRAGLLPSLYWHVVLNGYALYDRRVIPKRSGGTRVLHIPHSVVRAVQSRILHEILNPYAWPEHVAAYVQQRSPQAAAAAHAGRPVLIVIDIQDFFPTIRRSWVRNAVADLLGYHEEAAESFAAAVTAPWAPGTRTRFRVPQGAPTSGAVANLVAVHRLDPGILRVCGAYGMTYTRYADDLAFSRSTDLSKTETHEFIVAVMAEIKRAGFRVNYDKLRVQRRQRQQRLLGLTINEFPNIPSHTYRKTRALAQQVRARGAQTVAEERGYESGEALLSHLEGMCAYFSSVSEAKARGVRKYLEQIQ